jgi:tetratricopeptide (TPR) repeat protein
LALRYPLTLEDFSASLTKIVPTISLCVACLLVLSAGAAELHEYSAADARKHVGEKAIVVGTIDCIQHGRRHVDLIIGGCDLRKATLWIVSPNGAAGLELDPETIRGVEIAVTGKIESSEGIPQITIKSTTDIRPRSAVQTNYIGRAYDKEQKGDIAGAIEDLNQAIVHQPARRDEACQHLAKVKETDGDWAGALAAYDRLIALDPNKADGYYVRATAKKQHGDFESAMADYTRAAELRSSPADYVQIGNWRKERGDVAGANAEYEKAIELCDRQIAGTARSNAASPLGTDPYFGRGYAKELKGDVDGAIADYSQAITNNPARAAMAYGARGNIRKARGDTLGAISDYQRKYQITNYPDDEKILRQLRAQLSRGKSFSSSDTNNKTDVTPEPIPEAFVQAYSGMDVDAVANLYSDRVDYANNGVIGRADIRKQAREYFARWPKRQWGLTGPVKTTSMGPSRQEVIFSATYDASNPHTNKHTSGVATETLIVASDVSGAMKIVSQKEQTNKRSSSGSDEETSDAPGLRAAKAEYDSSSHDEAARVRYVTKLAAMLGEGMEYWWRTHDRMGGPNVSGVEEELRKHPMARNVDSRELSQLLIGEWGSSRHVYAFRGDGTYGVGDEQRDKWRIYGNKYIDDVSRGPIILLDRNYFIYAEGQGVAFYMRVKDSNAERNESADINTQGNQKLTSADGKYSIEVAGTEDSLVLSHGGEVIAKVPTSVGPAGSLFEALWHPNGSYVAVNKQRSSRPGGDSMWILALPTGKVLRKPDDAFWNELQERADAYIDENLSETKEFPTLIATGWGKGGLRFRLEVWLSEMKVRYFFDGTVEPLNLRTINDWNVSKTK